MVSTTSNVLATIGTVCWCVQMIPQIIFNYKKKNTEGFPENMALLWCLCAPFFAAYVVIADASIPIMLQPHLFCFFCFIVYIQIMYYPPVSRPKKQILIRGGLFILFQICIEVGCIIPLRILYKRGTTWPALIFGIIASILLAVGLIPPYFELWKRNGQVIGINFLFLTVDFAGAVFSLASLAVDPTDLDIMGLVLYLICAFLELGIFVSQFVWLIRFKLLKRSKTVDDEKQIEIDQFRIDDENKDSDIDINPSASSDSLDAEITRNESEFDKEEKKQHNSVDETDLAPIQTLV